MSNMSYCRFHNTLSDLRDCFHNLEGKLSEDENEARSNLIFQCLEIIEAVGLETEDPRSKQNARIEEFCASQQEAEDDEDDEH